MYLLRRILIGLVLPVALLTAACGGSNNSPTQPTTPPPQGPADLQIIELQAGTGDATVVTNKVVYVAYALWLYDPAGTDSKGVGIQQNTFQFRTGTTGTIPGFEQGVMGMKVGQVRRLIIPPNLAYGTRGDGGSIPGNAWLVFEVQVLQISD
jgi:FKBP-type peptidyl-prolyl cis-trans isomerase FkpA